MPEQANVKVKQQYDFRAIYWDEHLSSWKLRPVLFSAFDKEGKNDTLKKCFEVNKSNIIVQKSVRIEMSLSSVFIGEYELS
jgi:hypothetical protein